MKAKVEQGPKGSKIVREPCAEPCAIERGMRLLGGKWTGSILWHLQDGPVRFNDLTRLVGGASKKMISERLRHLEAQGLARRRMLSSRPLAVAYEITPLGRTALDCLDALRRWSESLPAAIGPEAEDPPGGPSAALTSADRRD